MQTLVQITLKIFQKKMFVGSKQKRIFHKLGDVKKGVFRFLTDVIGKKSGHAIITASMLTSQVIISQLPIDVHYRNYMC